MPEIPIQVIVVSVISGSSAEN